MMQWTGKISFVVFTFGIITWGNSPSPQHPVSHATPKVQEHSPVASHAPDKVTLNSAGGHGIKLVKSPSDEALKRLIAGNRRYVAATMAHPNQTIERRNDLALSQAPFAVVVSCSDSRVPPEILFDQGVGDLFVVRSAGEVVGEVGIGSIEYAIAHLGSTLILVLGHERCGAVKATIEGGDAPGSIGFICAHIKPAADKAKKQGGDVLHNAIQYNVENVANKISQSPIIRDALVQGTVKIVRAVYDLDDGLVKPIP